MKKSSNRIQNENGIALLLVLWIITLFAVICTEFSWTMRTETVIARNFKDGEQAYYTAEAGINRAIIELERASKKTVQSTDEDTDDSESKYWEPGGGPYSFKLDENICEIKIEDESNRLGLNSFLKKAKSNPSLLKNLIEGKIGLEGEERDIVADSLIDWWDKDQNITGVNGTESDYYESLDKPYKCRDGQIPVVEELLFVRGVTEEVYYGTVNNPEQKITLTEEELEKLLAKDEDINLKEDDEDMEDDEDETMTNLGLRNIFSIFSTSTSFKPNINTASFEQLLLVEGIDTDCAAEIIEERNNRLYASKTDRLPQLSNYEVWQNNIQVKSAKSVKFFKITATGFSEDRQISRVISCNVAILKNRHTISSWKAGS